jgi:thioredoxin reductase (NADPH)
MELGNILRTNILAKMVNVHKTKVLIIGSGPAGCSAGIYASRAALNPILVQGRQPGGQLTITTDVENYPGFADSVQGPWLMEQMEKQASNGKCEVVRDHIVSIDCKRRPFNAIGESGNKYVADSIIIATGAQAKWLDLPSEKKFMGYGVSGCATCDGFFYKNKKVIVVGGGNTAIEESIYLTKHVDKVYLIHRRDKLRADIVLQERLRNNRKIEVLWSTILQEIIGHENPHSVTGVKFVDVKTNIVNELEIDGVFIAIGHKPNTELFKDILNIDNEGYIITKPDKTATSIDGVYAAGDVQDKNFRQAVTAAGTGCMAALEATAYLG